MLYVHFLPLDFSARWRLPISGATSMTPRQPLPHSCLSMNWTGHPQLPRCSSWALMTSLWPWSGMSAHTQDLGGENTWTRRRVGMEGRRKGSGLTSPPHPSTPTSSSLNQPFGSGLITPSGILLNSQMLDFSWPNRTANHSAPSLVGPCFPHPQGP